MEGIMELFINHTVEMLKEECFKRGYDKKKTTFTVWGFDEEYGDLEVFIDGFQTVDYGEDGVVSGWVGGVAVAHPSLPTEYWWVP